MEPRPDYSIYHLQELESALAKIDETANREEAEVIREYIKRGGYTYPKEPEIIGVRFVSATYKWALVSVLTILFLTNFYLLVIADRLLAVVPIAFQAAILLVIYRKHKHTRGLIKAWSTLLVISGAFGALAQYFAQELDWIKLADHLVTFAGGMAFFVLSNRFVELVPMGSNQPLENNMQTGTHNDSSPQ